MEKFKLKADSEYIELNKLMKNLSWILTGGEAKARITSGEVKVNGEVETQIRKKLRSGDKIDFDGENAVVE